METEAAEIQNHGDDISRDLEQQKQQQKRRGRDAGVQEITVRDVVQ